MSSIETVIRHMERGTTYSWDLTVLLGAGIAISASLRNSLLLSRTTADEAEYVRAVYTGRLLAKARL